MAEVSPLAQLDAFYNCHCRQCHEDRGEQQTFYILCPDCGNKRCPKATDHRHECSGSNAPGQEGSAYGNWEPR